MYKIEKKNYGFKITFEGFIKQDEMTNWATESNNLLSKAPKNFGVVVDMRNMKALPKDAQDVMVAEQQQYKSRGMQRSAVVLNSAIVTMQFKNIAKETGIYEYERYIDASTNPNWEEDAVNWVQNSINPL